MKAAFQTRVLAIALAIATLAICVLAGFNLVHENAYDVPTDGIWWIEAQGGLRADRVPVGSPGERAGIRTGDLLLAINDHPTPRLAPFTEEVYRSGIWAHATYSILRPMHNTRAAHTAPPRPAKFDVQIILEPTDRNINQVQRFIALVYLSIGLYVLFRRWTAPKSTSFLTSSVSSRSSSTRSNTPACSTDWTGIDSYWGNIAGHRPAAGAFPALCASSFSDSDEPDHSVTAPVAAFSTVP